MAVDSKALIVKVLSSFEASRILLVEWENSLFERLGYPAVPSDLVYLVPDEQLLTARDIAASHGLRPANRDKRIPSYASEFANIGFFFLINDSPEESWKSRRLILLPMSWTGINSDELVPIPILESQAPPPCTVWTVPLPALCAAFVRMVAREHRGSELRSSLIANLCNVLTYNLFDMSYDGDYMKFQPDDQPLTEKEILEMTKAISEINGWVLRKDDEWIRNALVRIVSGKDRYVDLPCKKM